MSVNMRRKSTAASASTCSRFSIKNTGLRPKWDEFWALQEEIEQEDAIRRREAVHSLPDISKSSSGSAGPVMKRFVTGSDWFGEWDRLGMNGTGVYKMAHGVTYEGVMNMGLFEGVGVLKYPNGGALEGFWHKGKLKYCQYLYADGLRRDSTNDWPYCKTPDRRFYSELQQGLKPAEEEQVSNEEPPLELPPGHYDAGDGFYNPRTKCVTDPHTGEILRIPTAAEEQWILENCRAAEIGTVGYRPEMYKNWFDEQLGVDIQREEIPIGGDEILRLILQMGSDLQSPSSTRASRARSLSLQFKIDYLGSLGRIYSGSSLWSRSNMDVEAFLRNLIRELNVGKLRNFASIQKTLTETMVSDKSEKSGDTVNKLAATPSSTGTKQFSLATPYSPDSSKKTVMKFSSPFKEREYHSKNKDLGSLQSEFLGSKFHYNIDYTEYEHSIKSKSTI